MLVYWLLVYASAMIVNDWRKSELAV